MTSAPLQNFLLQGGRTYSVHSMSLDAAQDLARLLADAAGFQLIVFAFEQGNRETVEKVRDAIVLSRPAPTVFFVASDRPYTNDSQALMLKALEELHENVAVILYVRSKEDLLATIRSRAIELTSNSIDQIKNAYTQARSFLKTLPDARLKLLEEFVADEKVAYSTDDLVRDIEKVLVLEATTMSADLARIMHDVIGLYHDARLQRTIPPKTLFEYLAVSLPVV